MDQSEATERLREWLPVNWTEHPNPLCLQWCGFECRGVCAALDGDEQPPSRAVADGTVDP